MSKYIKPFTTSNAWQYEDSQFEAGVTLNPIFYVGSLPVKISIKQLDIESQFKLTREAIYQVCDSAGLFYNQKCIPKHRYKHCQTNQSLFSLLGNQPNFDHSGETVRLKISKSELTIISIMSGVVIGNHPLYRVSFALSYGCKENQLGNQFNYAAYVVNDVKCGRVCMVFDCCSKSRALEFCSTIKQAFHLRSNQNEQQQDETTSEPNDSSDCKFKHLFARGSTIKLGNGLPGRLLNFYFVQKIFSKKHYLHKSSAKESPK